MVAYRSGYEVAEALVAPLDIFLVRKLGVPGQEELAMGAIASGGIRVLNEPIVQMLGLTEGQIERVEQEERHELERRSTIIARGVHRSTLPTRSPSWWMMAWRPARPCAAVLALGPAKSRTDCCGRASWARGM